MRLSTLCVVRPHLNYTFEFLLSNCEPSLRFVFKNGISQLLGDMLLNVFNCLEQGSQTVP